VKPQLAPSQVGAPSATDGQGVHEVPQESVLRFERQAPAQSWNPGAQVMPQLFPSQVAVPFADGHGLQEAPQVAGAASLAQASPQRW
jgi:hypothetical protein